MFDTDWEVASSALNVDQPPDIPQRPMGRIPAVVRLPWCSVRAGHSGNHVAAWATFECQLQHVSAYDLT
jgi:hypothetical protein